MGSPLFQMYYTSCEKGMSGYAGYQTRACSKDFSHEDISDIERHCLYPLSYDMPQEPSQKEIRSFPTVFTFIRLYSQATALIHISYLGQDYSGRWGNYIAHAIVSSSYEFWISDLLFWENWKTSFGNEEGMQEPRDLPVLNSDTLVYSRSQWFSKITKILSHADHRDLFSRMLLAVFAYQKDGRSIVIRAKETTSINFWISLIHRAFPQKIQSSLSFCNFVTDPASCHVINGTIGETKFSFGSTERNYQYYIFDFVESIHPSFEHETNEYVRLVVPLFSDGELLNEFHSFCLHYPKEEVDADLVHWIQLFLIYRDHQQKDDSNLDVIISFLYTNIESFSESFLKRVLLSIGKTLTNHLKRPLYERIQLLDSLLAFPVAGGSKYQACLAFFWLKLLPETERGDKSKVLAFRDQLPNIREVMKTDFFQTYVVTILRQKHPKTMLFILEQIQYFEPGKRLNPVVRNVLMQLSSESLRKGADRRDYIDIFLRVCFTTEEFCAQIQFLYQKSIEKSNSEQELIDLCFDIGQVLEDTISHTWEEQRWSIYSRLYQQRSLHELLFLAYTRSIKRAANKKEMFAGFQQRAFQKQGLSKQYIQSTHEVYWEALSITEKRMQAMSWLKENHAILSCEQLRIDVVQTVAKAISFALDDTSAQAFASLVHHRFQKIPSLILCRFAFDQARADDRHISPFLETIIQDTESTKKFIVEGLCSWLEGLTKKISYVEYREILLTFRDSSVFLGALKKYIKIRKASSFQRVDIFLMIFCLEENYQELIQLLEMRLQKMEPEVFESVKNNLIKESPDAYLLNDMLERVEEHRLSAWSKLKRSFFSIFSKK